MLRRSLFTTLALVTAATYADECATATPAQRPGVVELYTSEGCSSCPPADRWARALQGRDDLVVAAFHVDYWDRLGWKDPWSDARFSARQHARAARTVARVVYTPDVVFDGRSRTDWSRGWTPARTATRAPFDLQVSLARRPSGRLAVHWRSPDAPATSRAWIAVTESGQSSRPSRGENAGALLRHAHVVRAYVDDLDATGGASEIALPVDLGLDRAFVNVVVEDVATARPLHAARLPLATCRVIE